MLYFIWCAKVGGCSLQKEVMTMADYVTYEGLFLFVTMLTGVVALIVAVYDSHRRK